MSKLVLQWKLAYLKKVLDHDLKLLHWLQLMRQVVAELRVLPRRKDMVATRHFETRQMQNFYKLFQNWTMATRHSVYTDLRKIRLFRLGLVVSSWRKYLGKTEANRNKENAALRFRAHQLLTKALISIYTHKLKQSRLKCFQKRWAYLKFFKRRWVPKAQKS